MTLSEVKDRLSAIRAIKQDDEAAHIAQDRLWAEVLGAIALGAEQPAALAAEALEAADIEFERWYA